MEEQGHTIVRDDPSRVQLLLDGGGDGVKGGRVGQVPELPQQVVHWQIGGGAAIGETVTFAVRHRLPAKTVGKLCQQPRLAHAGLPDKAHGLPLPTGREREPLVQQRQLPGPADKATQGPRAAPRHARRRRRPCTTYPATGMAVASLVPAAHASPCTSSCTSA